MGDIYDIGKECCDDNTGQPESVVWQALQAQMAELSNVMLHLFTEVESRLAYQQSQIDAVIKSLKSRVRTGVKNQNGQLTEILALVNAEITSRLGEQNLLINLLQQQITSEQQQLNTLQIQLNESQQPQPTQPLPSPAAPAPVVNVKTEVNPAAVNVNVPVTVNVSPPPPAAAAPTVTVVLPSDQPTRQPVVNVQVNPGSGGEPGVSSYWNQAATTYLQNVVATAAATGGQGGVVNVTSAGPSVAGAAAAVQALLEQLRPAAQPDNQPEPKAGEVQPRPDQPEFPVDLDQPLAFKFGHSDDSWKQKIADFYGTPGQLILSARTMAEFDQLAFGEQKG